MLAAALSLAMHLQANSRSQSYETLHNKKFCAQFANRCSRKHKTTIRLLTKHKEWQHKISQGQNDVEKSRLECTRQTNASFVTAMEIPPCLGCCRPLQAEEEDLLREALLASGTDPEAPVDSSRKRRRSWYSLLGTAITYVWPDSVILQLRAFTCIVLILIMRVLNLAVPILYKKVVDTLASTSEGTHPRPGEEREYFQFWQVRREKWSLRGLEAYFGNIRTYDFTCQLEARFATCAMCTCTKRVMCGDPSHD